MQFYHNSFLANRLVSELVIKETAYSNERVYNCSASNFFKDKRRTDYDFVDVTVGMFSNTRKYFTRYMWSCAIVATGNQHFLSVGIAQKNVFSGEDQKF